MFLMSAFLKRIFYTTGVCSLAGLLPLSPQVYAQTPVSSRAEIALLRHGIEQFNQGHFALAARSIQDFLNQHTQPTDSRNTENFSLSIQQARYLLAVSNLKANADGAEDGIRNYIEEAINPVYRQKAAFALAQHYFRNNNLSAAIEQYELAGIDNLSNTEIVEAKFELAYSYFNEKQFDKAKPLFAVIKELPDHKYYVAGNYYYGLLAYNDKNYDAALKSFERVHNQQEYKDIVPYYEAEIHYFQGNYDKVLQLSGRYLKKSEPLYYDKEMRLLTGQTYFEQKKFKEALPYFEYYYENSEKIRKEELYELAYTYYMLDQWPKAISRFQPLSNALDSLGQTSMYLLGDCYLKIGDKKGARNAFGVCADMDFNPSQKEAASFLYAKLCYEMGDESLATRRFYEFLNQYPRSVFQTETKKMLSGLLSKSSNYSEAFAIMSDMALKDEPTWAIYQQVGLGLAMQHMQNNRHQVADSILNLTLQQPVNANYEAIAYFWKGEIAYREKRYPQAIQFSERFLHQARGKEDAIRRISGATTVQNAYLNIGYAQLEQENYGLAKEAFAQAATAKDYTGADTRAADALLRQADASFMLKDFDKAAALYEKAIGAGISNPDYARFQKSLILGLQGNQAEKVNLLNQIIQKQPASEYRNDARYELAVSYLEMDRHTEAISLLKVLSEPAGTNDALKGKAIAKLAFAYQEAGRNTEAIATYKELISKYPSSPERAAATDALRNLYIATGRPEEYAAFLDEHQLPTQGDESIEQTFYAAAETDYANEQWARAAEGFTKYLNRFSNGNMAVKARFYRAESYFKLKDMTKALQDYDAVVMADWNDFSEDAAARAAGIADNMKDYTAAQKYYNSLRSLAMDSRKLQVAYAGLLRSAYGKGDFAAADAYADTLISLPELPAALLNEAQLYKARSLQNSNRLEDAKVLYQVIDKKNTGLPSVEARYRIAEILLSQKKLAEAETQASYAAQTAAGFDPWMVRSYLLIADILTEQKDYFNAKATLQSIIKNNKDSEIKAEATSKLQKVKMLEKAQSKLSEE
jgi:tetratricopeptide (TPR) repeat protein